MHNFNNFYSLIIVKIKVLYLWLIAHGIKIKTEHRQLFHLRGAERLCPKIIAFEIWSVQRFISEILSVFFILLELLARWSSTIRPYITFAISLNEAFSGIHFGFRISCAHGQAKINLDDHHNRFLEEKKEKALFWWLKIDVLKD